MFWTLVRIALRNLVAHKVKSLIVGTILVFGTLLVLLGASLLGSIEMSMADSIVGSVSGHLQISADGAKDTLVLFPGPLDGNEIGVIQDFPKVRAELEALPEVEAVIPQGFDYAMIFAANLIDTKLAKLRTLHKAGDSEGMVPVRDHVRRIVSLLDSDLQRIRKVIHLERDDTARKGVEDVHEAAQPAFWADFEANFDKRMEFLENRVAQMAIGEDVLFIRYMGTDVERFTKAFDRFELLKGEPIPPGQRGLLLNSLYYEEMLKHKTARRLDKIRDKRAEGATFETDKELQEWRRMNVAQYKEITWQLDDAAQARVAASLRAALGSEETDLDALTKALLTTDDSNFDARYELFYSKVAPELRLYRVDVGETLTIRALSQGGYMSSVNVKIYGTFRFRGMDKSALAGMVNLMDIVSFRDLYGHVTAEQKEEIRQLEQRSGVKEVSAEQAEDAFFGEGAEVEEDAPSGAAVAGAAVGGAAVGGDAGLAADVSPSDTAGLAEPTSPTGGFDEFARVDMGQGAQRWSDTLFTIRYSQDDIDGGVVRNAAIVLKDRKQIEAATAKIQEISKAKGLGIKVLDWRQASGMLGQFVAVIYAVLLIAILGVFGVALLIINNSMVLSTIERTREIGTMRAIGGSRRFVLWMFLVESIVLGSVFGAIGVGLGAAVVGWLGQVGIAAPNDTMVFIFGGPRLYPSMNPGHIAFALALVIVVTIISTVYPTMLATRITPLEAMQPKEE